MTIPAYLPAGGIEGAVGWLVAALAVTVGCWSLLLLAGHAVATRLERRRRRRRAEVATLLAPILDEPARLAGALEEARRRWGRRAVVEVLERARPLTEPVVADRLGRLVAGMDGAGRGLALRRRGPAERGGRRPGTAAAMGPSPSGRARATAGEGT